MLIKYSFEDLESHRAGINVELDKSPLQQLLEPLECTQSLSKLKTLRNRYQALYPQAQKKTQKLPSFKPPWSKKNTHLP